MRNMTMRRRSWKGTEAPPTMARRPVTARARFSIEATETPGGEARTPPKGADEGALRAELALPRQARPESEEPTAWPQHNASRSERSTPNVANRKSPVYGVSVPRRDSSRSITSDSAARVAVYATSRAPIAALTLST